MAWSLRFGVKLAFGLSVFTILLIEFYLIYIDGPFEWCYAAGVIILKLSYSIMAATIFFYINQQIPKEEKKQKFYVFINNKLMDIREEVASLMDFFELEYFDLDEQKIPKEIYEAIEEKCRSAVDRSFLTSESGTIIRNFAQYVIFKEQRIAKLTSELVAIQEHLDADILEEILDIRTEMKFNADLFPESSIALPNTFDESLIVYRRLIFKIFMAIRNALRILESKYILQSRLHMQYYNTKTKDWPPLEFDIARRID